MKQSPRILPVLLCILIALVVHTGCRENTLINSKVSPTNNAIGVFDTSLACITHSYFDDTVNTSYHFSGVFQGVGAMTDSYFGTMNSAVYFNVFPSEFTPITPSAIDSVVLVLPFSGFSYGDTIDQNATQTYQVFYLDDTLGYGTNYYPFSSKPIDHAHPLCEPTVVNTYHMRDSFGINVLPQNHPGLHIRLNVDQIGKRLCPVITAASTTSTDPSGDFLKYFNGICVQVADSRKMGNSMPYFQLDGSTMFTHAGFIVYWHDTATQDSLPPINCYFDINYCSHFNSVIKSYSHFPVNQLYNSTQPNDQVVAVQSQPGSSIDVIVPGISKLPVGIINKAELQLSILPGNGNILTPSGGSILLAPQRLNPTGVGMPNYPQGVDPGQLYNIADKYPIYSSTPLNVLDGTVHTVPGTSRQYMAIDIPREVMASIAAKNDTIHLHIDGSQNFYGAFHLLAGGGSYPDTLYRAKLFVVYSKLK